MDKGTLRGKRPAGLARRLYRAPIALYRIGLGFLMGGRFLMVEHTGRKSDQPRYTVLEVVRYDRDADTYVVASGWGERSDWFRNVTKTPDIYVSSGLRRRRAARAIRLPLPEAERELCNYGRRHPQAFSTLSRFMLGDTAQRDCHAAAQVLPLVAFKIVPQKRD